jgi:hypothetical protein
MAHSQKSRAAAFNGMLFLTNEFLSIVKQTFRFVLTLLSIVKQTFRFVLTLNICPRTVSRGTCWSRWVISFTWHRLTFKWDIPVVLNLFVIIFSGSAAQRGLWPPLALKPSAGYGLLWLCSPARAMASSGSAAQRGLWPPLVLNSCYTL